MIPTAKHNTPWSPEEVAILRSSYDSLGPSAIAARVGRSTRAVAHKAAAIGLVGFQSSGRRPRAPAVPSVPRAREPALDLSDPAVRAAVSARIAELGEARRVAEAERDDAARPWAVPGVEAGHRRSWNGRTMPGR